MIKAIIFDFGRVISAQKPMSLFWGYERELGLAPGVLNRVMFGSEAWQDVLVGRKSLDDYWLEIGPGLGLHTPDKIQAFRQHYFSDESINEGVLELLRELHGRYKLAVLSNAPPRLSKWLADWGILGLFDVVVCSGDEGVVKPDPAIYELAWTRLGVAPEEAIFIDDSPGHVAAARALGLHGIHFTTAEALRAELDGLLGHLDPGISQDGVRGAG
jgi:epoxide hydrolase-like predicted phosphatase